ncbi:MAG: N-carbamoylputrescine amidase, partial [Candidatus Hydrogenedentes bacterium]|nr:N-carbamoylputrescine amidase [Candidatus Hydrogenedentota bacterium]
MSKSDNVSTGNFRIGVLQLAMSPDPDANLKNAVDWVGRAAKQDAQVVCLPEMYRTQYFCQREDIACFDWAEPVPGPSTEAFRKAARKHKVAVIVPIFERRAAGVYHNSAAVIDAD